MSVTHTPITGKTIALAHGGGGQLTDELIAQAILPRLGNATLNALLDSAILPASGADRLAMTTDSYVVTPWSFPGADIGRLAVCGTVNDLAVCGATPMGISLALILAEGFARRDLDTVLDSIAAAAQEAGVPVVTGDTKVVGRNQADGIYITTTGVGRIPIGRSLSPKRVQPGDLLVVNGPVGEHGLAVMLAREMPDVQSALKSDAAPLNAMIEDILEQTKGAVKFMRDPTRSGLAGVAADLAAATGWHVTLTEADIPVRPEARHAAEMLGLDPLEVANEGKVVAVVEADHARRVVKLMHQHPLGREAALIGRVDNIADGLCELHTDIGGRRILTKPYGELLPRIC
jgi:hydrogenase expression/formation protein HypE